MIIKNVKHVQLKDSESCLEYTKVKDDLIEYKYLCCYRNVRKSLMKT